MSAAKKRRSAVRARGGGDLALVDSSLWIEYLAPARGGSELRDARQRALSNDQVGITTIILVEVLRGAPDRGAYDALVTSLTALRWLSDTVAVGTRAAEIGFALERKGKRVPATDLLIAASAIENDYTLWHNDARFEVIASAAPLRHLRFGR